MTKTCATCKYWNNKNGLFSHRLEEKGTGTGIGFCETTGENFCPRTWADATCPAWAEREDAAARAARRIWGEPRSARGRDIERDADIIREEQAKEAK